jgi:hypothetical protein
VVAAAHSDLDLILLHFDRNVARAKLVNALRFSEEHNLQLGAVRIVVDVIGQALVELVVRRWDANCYLLLQVDGVQF